MERMKRQIAGFLCLVMLFCAVPFQAVASDTGNETPEPESVMESQESIPVESASEPEPTETEAVEVPVEETESTEVTQEETETTEEETVPTEIVEEETEPSEEETEPTEEEPEPSEEEDSGEPRWLYSVNGSGYAVIEGYTDDGVTELSVPYSVDGYYVVAIGEKAFVNNTALSAVYIHGNVMSIAANAFEGLSPVLSGYHGTYVMAYASENGFAFRNRANQSALALAEGVIDYSYVEGSRYSFPDGSTVIMSLPEALLLSVGRQFYIPQADDGLPGIYEVLSMEERDGSAVISVKNTADSQEEEIPPEEETAPLADPMPVEKVEIPYTAADSLRLLEVKQVTKNSVSLEWNEVKGADGYYLYRKQGSAGTYTLIKSVTGTSTSNFSLTPGNTYYYKVQAYTLVGGNKVKGVESQEVSITISAMTTPAILQVVQTSATTACMSWSKINGAEGYEVYDSASEGGTYTHFKTEESTQTVMTDLLPGMTYYYKVRAYSTADGETIYSAWSDIYQFVMPERYLAAPANLTVRMTAPGTVTLKWDSVEGAVGYDIYRQTGAGSFSLIKSIAGNETYNYNLTAGNTYSYKVSAFYYQDEVKKSGNQSAPVSVEILSVGTPYIKSVTQSAAGTALVKWSSVGSAKGYELYRSRTEDGTYALMKSVTGIETSNYNLTSGVTYYYKVRAFVETANGTREYGAYSAAVPITISEIAQVRIKSVTPADGTSAKVLWASQKNAQGYEVWRSEGDNANYQLLRDTTGTAIQDRNLKEGIVYYYKIRGYKAAEEGRIYGAFSKELSQMIISPPALKLASQVGPGKNEVMWSQSAIADGYELWSSTSADGTYTLVKDTSVTTETITDLTVGTTYYYKVRAYQWSGGEKVYSAFSSTGRVKVMGIPEISKLSQNGASAVTITWRAAEAAEGYELYRSTNESGPYQKVKRIVGTSTGNYSLEEGGRYYYKLRGYGTVAGQKQYGPYGSSLGITLLSTPVISEVVQKSTSSCKITWEPVENAASYKLYRSTSPEGVFSLIKSVTDTTTMNYSLQGGCAYYYKVKAVMEENQASHESAYSKAVGVYLTSLQTPAVQSITQEGSSGVSIRWNPISGAEGYEIWRTEKGGTYSLISSTEETAFVDQGRSHGVAYQYMVRAFETAEGFEERFYSQFSPGVSLVLLDAPGIRNAYQRTTTTAKITWETDALSEGYELWRAVGDGAFGYVATVTESFALDNSLVKGRKYSYQVRSYQMVNGVKSYSAFSETVTLEAVEFTQTDGVYQIDGPAALNCFSKLVACGENTSSAILRANISATADFVPIGNAQNPFRGVFDGNGFTVTLNINGTDDFQGLIGAAGAGAAVRNVTVAGSVRGGTAVGGIVGGSTQSGTVTIENCWNQAAVTASANAGGILGSNWNSKSTVTIKNCCNNGKIKGSRESGAISGWLGSGANVINCCNFGTVSGFASGKSFAGYRDAKFTNCYQLDSIGKQANITAFTAEQLASGEIAYKLGEGWGQKIGSDPYPLWNGTKVYANTVLACDGVTVASVVYSNTEESIVQDHVDEDGDGVCDACEAVVSEGVKPHYRALLIGEASYDEKLEGPENDVRAMRNILTGLEMGYEVYSQMDATRAEIIGLINVAFSGATEDDISLFYYSGHGVMNSGEYYSGAIMPVDYNCITTNELASLLSAVPGKVIVILDSCGSGAAISNGTVTKAYTRASGEVPEQEEATCEFDPLRFSQAVIAAFQPYSLSTSAQGEGMEVMGKAMEFRTSKFYVITASAYEEYSWSISFGQEWGGYFTRGISASAGFTFPTAAFSGSFPGDANADKVVTISECAQYCASYVSTRQHVLSYPADSTLPLFFDGRGDTD